VNFVQNIAFFVTKILQFVDLSISFFAKKIEKMHKNSLKYDGRKSVFCDY